MNASLVKTESNAAFLRTWVASQESLIPSFAKEEANKTERWSPEKGVWYTAEKAGKVGGGWGGAGSGAWEDKGIPVLAGDKFRLVSYGSPASPSVWEIKFTSALR